MAFSNRRRVVCAFLEGTPFLGVFSPSLDVFPASFLLAVLPLFFVSGTFLRVWVSLGAFCLHFCADLRPYRIEPFPLARHYLSYSGALRLLVFAETFSLLNTF